MSSMHEMDSECSRRKLDHLELAGQAQMQAQIHAQALRGQIQRDFNYEPLLGHHPGPSDLTQLATRFLGFSLSAPFWISSMTGGTEKARTINERLARACGHYQLPLALGSCRSLLHSRQRVRDFDVKKYMGKAPLFANLGLAQLDQLLAAHQLSDLLAIVADLGADGLVIHVNPLQEWIQPNGDRWSRNGLEILQQFLGQAPQDLKLIIKEVGQGLGPRSIRALMELPIAAIEMAGFGGTNFSEVERLRAGGGLQEWSYVGHTAAEMVEMVAGNLREKAHWPCANLIISGGIRSVFDGQALLNKLACPALIGQAYAYLNVALAGQSVLEQFIHQQMMELLMVRSFLCPK